MREQFKLTMEHKNALDLLMRFEGSITGPEVFRTVDSTELAINVLARLYDLSRQGVLMRTRTDHTNRHGGLVRTSRFDWPGSYHDIVDWLVADPDSNWA